MSRVKHVRPLEIMHIEDNMGDLELVKAAFRKSTVRVNLTWARDGAEGVSLLESRGNLTDLVLLDWNLPKKSGADVLRKIKLSKSLRRIPVVILTSSASPEDISTAYDLGASCYLRKSVSLAETRRVLKSLESFWFGCVRYVERPRHREVVRRD